MPAPPMPEDWNAVSTDEMAERLRATGLPRRLFELMRDEDLGPSGTDATAAALRDPDHAAGPLVSGQIEAVVRVREPCVVAGLTWLADLAAVFGRGRTGTASFAASTSDGARADAGDAVGVVRGPLGAVVGLERSLLNLLSRLSGVATRAAAFAAEIPPGSRCRVFDTRKTTPGLRALEKHAVRCGGACCHRMGLHDAVLIKDNHLAGVTDAELPGLVRAASERGRAAGASFVEIEVDRVEQLDALLTLEAGVVDVVLLDNMTPGTLAEAARRRDRRGAGPLLEASGGVTLERVAPIAGTGVDRVSSGSITRDAGWIDFGLDR